MATALLLLLLGGDPSAGAVGRCPDCGYREIAIASRALGERRVARVRLPPGYEEGADRFPVIYVLDGEAHLEHVAATATYLAGLGAMPPAIVVGVQNVDRIRDFTPTRAAVEEDGRRMDLPTSGGADRFLRYLRGELVPFIDAHLRTRPFRVLWGHSFAGLLVLHAFATSPEDFHGYVAASPSAHWDGGRVVVEIERRLSSPAPLPRSVFVTLGNEPRMVRGFDALRKALASAAPVGFRWEAMRLPGDSHGFVVLPTTAYGLRWPFADWHPPLDTATGRIAATLPEVEVHYRRLSGRLGWEILPPEELLNALGYQLLAERQVEGAIAALERNVALRPASANAHDSLGEALHAAGRHSDARREFQRAVDLGEASGSPLLPGYRAHLDAAERRHLDRPGLAPP